MRIVGIPTVGTSRIYTQFKLAATGVANRGTTVPQSLQFLVNDFGSPTGTGGTRLGEGNVQRNFLAYIPSGVAGGWFVGHEGFNTGTVSPTGSQFSVMWAEIN